MLPRRKLLSYRWSLVLVMLSLLAGVFAIPMAAFSALQDSTLSPTPEVTASPFSPPANPTLTARTVELYGLFEVVFEVPGSYDNPYDPGEIDVVGVFSPPDGSPPLTVPAFYMQPCLDGSGVPVSGMAFEWHLRFTPNQVGTWSYTVQVRQPDDELTILADEFEVVPSYRPGFIRTSANPRYFAFENGLPYFPVGHNLAWSWNGVDEYEQWLDDLSTAQANYARLYVDVPWFIGLDWPGPAGNYDAAQGAACRLDRVLTLAEERGIYLQLTLVWHQSFAPAPDAPPLDIPAGAALPPIETGWNDNPFNEANGGPLTGPSALFFDAHARALLQNRMRYVVGRWGYSPNVFAWEIVDQLDNMQGYTPTRAETWLQNTITDLRAIDPYDHLVTAGTRQPVPELWQLPELDFIQVHYYQNRPQENNADQVTGVLNALSQAFAYTDGPVLLSEFSLNPYYAPLDDDPLGVHLRNTIWASALSGAAGGAMTWWWDAYVAEGDLYRIYTPLSIVSRGIPWNSPDLQPVQVGLIADTPVATSALRVADFNREFLDTSPPDTIYRLTADGAVPSTGQLSSYLYGAANADLSRPQTFVITPPGAAQLRIAVRRVSSDNPATLVITVDGIETTRVDFSPSSRDIVVTVPLSAGEHTVVLDNLGADWLELDYIEVTNYRTPVRVLALADRSRGTFLAWAHHRDYVWTLANVGVRPEALSFSLSVPDMPPGVYRVTFWDTTTGIALGEEEITLDEDNGGPLRISLLPISSQLAISALRIAGPQIEATPIDGTPVATRTPLPSPTLTASSAPEPSATLSPSPSLTLSPTASATVTPSPSATSSPTLSPTPTTEPTVTEEPTVDEPEATVTPSPTRTPRPSRTPSLTSTNTQTPSRTPSNTRTPRPSRTPSNTPTLTSTRTPRPSRTLTPTRTSTPTLTRTPSNTPTPTNTLVPSKTPDRLEDLLDEYFSGIATYTPSPPPLP
ncbi:MAG: DUF5060 domain-containing protein [Chloroflexi bacterium]|nr:DUF5060 domain-containing protein [Chloroflexota bacterium]